MKKNKFVSPLVHLHRGLSEILDVLMGPLMLIMLVAFFTAAGHFAMAQKGLVEFTPLALYIAGASFAGWAVLAMLRTAHGYIFLRWIPEPLEGTRWRTPAGAVGKFRTSYFNGNLELGFQSGVVADYRRETLVKVDDHS